MSWLSLFLFALGLIGLASAAVGFLATRRDRDDYDPYS